MNKVLFFFLGIVFILSPSFLIRYNNTYSYDYDDPDELIDIRIPDLNNHSLKEVFEDNQLVNNNSFHNGLTGWSFNNVSNVSVVGGILQYNEISSTIYPVSPLFPIIINHKYYIQTICKVPFSSTLRVSYTSENPEILVTEDLTFFSALTTATNSTNSTISIRQNSIVQTSLYVYIDFVSVYDLTSMGIEDLTLEEMDNWFNLYYDIVNDTVGLDTPSYYWQLVYLNNSSQFDNITSTWQNSFQEISEVVGFIKGFSNSLYEFISSRQNFLFDYFEYIKKGLGVIGDIFKPQMPWLPLSPLY